MLRQSASRLLAAAALASTFVGCSVYQAVVTDVGPSRGGDSVQNERLVAIGRTFEIQGKLDKAEQLYRLAVRRDPNDAEAMRRADYLAALRSGQMPPEENSAPWSFAARTSYASNSGAALSDPGAPTQVTPEMPLPALPTTTVSTVSTVSTEAAIEESVDLQTVVSQAASLVMAVPKTVQSEATNSQNFGSEYIARHTEVEETAPPVPAPEIPYETSATVLLVDTAEPGDLIPAHDRDSVPSVTFDVDAWMKSPGDHQEDLLAALEFGDTDTRSLAAYLLSDVAPQSEAVSSALYTASKVDTAEVVRLASCESLLIRTAADSDTIAAVLDAAASSDESTRVQAILTMRHLAGTEHSDRAVTSLTNALTDSSADVRAMAAATLGDLGAAAVSSLTALQDLANADDETSVRQACVVSIARIVKQGEDCPAGEISEDESAVDDGLTLE